MPANNQPAQTHWLTRWTIWILLLFTAVWFATLGGRRLLNPDEGRYAEIAREMSASGDWLTPRLNGLKYFEKPALQYWATAAAYEVLGENEFAARLWTGLTGFAGVLFAYFAGARLFGRSAAWLGATVLASSVLYVVVGHLNTLDMSLSFFLELAVFGFLLAQHAPPGSRAERAWMLLAWAATGFAFLSKGLVAGVLPVLTLLAYTVVTREYSAWKRLHIAVGLPIFVLISVPWIIAVSLKNPEFPQFFFFHEQFERFLTTIHNRDAPWWYFLPLLLLGALPWAPIMLQSLKSSWLADPATGFKPRRFLLLWVVAVVGFFSLSHSKLPPYIVPVFPALALVFGEALTRMKASTLQRHFLVVASVLFLIGIVIIRVPANIAGPKSVDVVADLRPETASSFLLAAYAIFAAAWLLRRYSVNLAVTVAGLGTMLALHLLVYGSDALRVTRSGYDLAQQIAAQVSPQDKLYSVGEYDQTLPFYLSRTMTLAGYRGELDFGLSQEPKLGLNDVAAFVQDWNAQSQAIAVMTPALYAELLNRGVPMNRFAEQYKLVAVRKP